MLSLLTKEVSYIGQLQVVGMFSVVTERRTQQVNSGFAHMHKYKYLHVKIASL